MRLTLKIWRQKNSETKGKIETYNIDDISPDMSFFRNVGRVKCKTYQ
jgi:succinate dehydrogenase / fumarate reductase iron-sulfur subunit